MIEKRIELLKRVDEYNKPMNGFACLNCPFSNLQGGFTSNVIKNLNGKWEDLYAISQGKKTHISDEDKKQAEEVVKKYQTKDNFIQSEKYNHFSSYCTKTSKFTFLGNPENYHHFEVCEFKENSINETIVEG